MKTLLLLLLLPVVSFSQKTDTWIRINQLGYKPQGIKVAVWCSKGEKGIHKWQLVNAVTGKIAYSGAAKNDFSGYGPINPSEVE